MTTSEIKKIRVVMGVNTWPEPDQHDFEIIEVAPGESDEDAIARAQSHYSPDLECYIVEKLGVSRYVEKEKLEPILSTLAAQAGFDVSMYDPEQDLDGLPMDFIPKFGIGVVKICAEFAKKAQAAGIQDVSEAILANFQVKD